jgi:hypothetical protein
MVGGVRWPDVSLPVPVDLSELPPEWQALAAAALRTWNGAGSRFWYVEGIAPGAAQNAVRVQAADQLPLCGGQWQPAACTYPFVYQQAPWHLSHGQIVLSRSRLSNDQPRRIHSRAVG